MRRQGSPALPVAERRKRRSHFDSVEPGFDRCAIRLRGVLCFKMCRDETSQHRCRAVAVYGCLHLLRSSDPPHQ